MSEGGEIPTVTLLAAVGENGVIGRDGGLPWHLPGDLPHVKRTTFGHVVVMGRRTYDSIGRPLPGRTTIVVTRDPDWAAAGVTACGDFDAALRIAAQIDSCVFVLGGADIYRLAMPYADRLLISEVPQAPEGDTYFPE
ncbi:MAG: dihydrofolate reductase, partial [Nocardioidaceae bacterium]